MCASLDSDSVRAWGSRLGFTWDRFAVAVVIDLNKSRSEQVKSSVATVGAINALLMK